MLRRVPCWYSEINVTFYCVTLARTIWLLDDGPRTETCRSVLMCKFYICAVVSIIIEDTDCCQQEVTKLVRRWDKWLICGGNYVHMQWDGIEADSNCFYKS